jgi:type II secretory pathway pseudopilin PulG
MELKDINNRFNFSKSSLCPENSKSFSGAFTLLEVLISLTILTAGIVFLFGFLFESMVALRHVKNRIVANFYINQQRWEIKKDIQSGRAIFDSQQHHNYHNIPFSIFADIEKIERLDNIYNLYLTVSWPEGKTIKKIWLEETIRGE